MGTETIRAKIEKPGYFDLREYEVVLPLFEAIRVRNELTRWINEIQGEAVKHLSNSNASQYTTLRLNAENLFILVKHLFYEWVRNTNFEGTPETDEQLQKQFHKLLSDFNITVPK